MRDLNPKKVISSHKGIFSDNLRYEFDTFILKFDERNERILSLLGEGLTQIEQLVDQAPIYGSFPYAEELLRYWEERMIEKHLQELLDQKRIFKDGREFFLS